MCVNEFFYYHKRSIRWVMRGLYLYFVMFCIKLSSSYILLPHTVLYYKSESTNRSQRVIDYSTCTCFLYWGHFQNTLTLCTCRLRLIKPIGMFRACTSTVLVQKINNTTGLGPVFIVLISRTSTAMSGCLATF